MHMCASDVVQGSDGRYYLYCQLHRLICTSVAVADRPEGPYKYYGRVQHEDGRYYLYVGYAPADKMSRRILGMRGNMVDHGVCMELAPDRVTVRSGEEST